MNKLHHRGGVAPEWRAEIRERMKSGGWHRDADDFIVDDATGKLIGPDPDMPEYWDEIDMSDAKPFAETEPELYASIQRNKVGRPKSDNPKRVVTIRLDADLVERLKAGGDGWQTRVNHMLRKAIGL